MPIVRALNPHTISQQEKRAKALRLRAAKMTYQKIAEECGYYDRNTARRACQQAMREVVQEPARELLILELEALDAMQGPLMAKAVRGDVPAAMGVLKIMERRGKLTGIEPKDQDGGDQITEVLIDTGILMQKREPVEAEVVEVDA